MNNLRAHKRLGFPEGTSAKLRKKGLAGRFAPARADLIDFTPEGLGFVASVPLEVGDIVFISFAYSIYEVKDLPGYVRYSTRADEGWHRGGVQFSLAEASPKQRETLQYQIDKIYARLDRGD